MRERSRAIAQSTVPAFITLAIVVAIATASAQNQPADLPELPAPVPRTYDVAAFVEGKSLPSGFSGLNTAIRSFSYIDLTTEDLGLRHENATGSNSALDVINLPESPGDTFSNSSSMVFPPPGQLRKPRSSGGPPFRNRYSLSASGTPLTSPPKPEPAMRWLTAPG